MAVKLSDFSTKDPNLWYLQVEADSRMLKSRSLVPSSTISCRSSLRKSWFCPWTELELYSLILHPICGSKGQVSALLHTLTGYSSSFFGLSSSYNPDGCYVYYFGPKIHIILWVCFTAVIFFGKFLNICMVYLLFQ